MLILLIDDDKEDFEIFCEALAIANPAAKCISAADGMRALHLLDELVVLPDKIFLDINMPLMDGKQFFKALRENKKLSEIPVTIYSTSSNPADYEELRRLGADHVIAKPTSFEKLISVLVENTR